MARDRKRDKQRRARRPAPVRPQQYGDAAAAFGEGADEAPEVVDPVSADEPVELPGGEDFPEGAEVYADELEARPVSAPAKGERGGNRVVSFLRASWSELKRVQWPDRRAVFQATAVVLGFVVVAGVYLGVADYVAQKIVNAII